MTRPRLKPLKGHAATYYTTGGHEQGYFIVGASTYVRCRCGWSSGGCYERYRAQRAYREHVEGARALAGGAS